MKKSDTRGYDLYKKLKTIIYGA